jgi:hypothetical protein
LTLELVLSSVGCAALCYSLGRYNRTLALQRWQFVLNVPEQRALESLRLRFELDGALARQALEAAERARRARRTPDALTVLRVALSILEEAGADRLTRLRAMAIYSRMVKAVRPLPAPSATPFRGRALRASATAAGLVHRFLVGTQERFRLWLMLMGLGVRIVLHGGRGAADAASREPERSGAWAAFAEGLDDFQALDVSHLAAFEALAASLAAVDRGGRLQLWERIAGDTR